MHCRDNLHENHILQFPKVFNRTSTITETPSEEASPLSETSRRSAYSQALGLLPHTNNCAQYQLLAGATLPAINTVVVSIGLVECLCEQQTLARHGYIDL